MARFPAGAVAPVLERAARVAGSALSRPDLMSARLLLAPDGSHVRSSSEGLHFSAPLPFAGVSEESVVALPAQLLADTVGRLPSGDVEVEFDADHATFRAGSGRFRIRRTDASDLLEAPKVSGALLDLDRADLFGALSAVSVASSRDASLRALTSVRLEVAGSTLTLVATDTHRLARQDVAFSAEEDDLEDSALLPPRLLSLLPRLFGRSGPLRLIVAHDGRSVSFAADGATLVASTVEAEFPRWRPLLASVPAASVVADRADLASVLERAALYGRSAGLKVEDGSLEVSVSDDSGDVSETLQVAVTGLDDVWSSRFDVGYLLDALRALPASTDVDLRVGAPTAAMHVVAGGSTHLVMPRR